MKQVRIFTPCWGFLHMQRMKRGLLTSLRWPRNRDALDGRVAGWHIYGNAADFPRIADTLDLCGYPIEFTAIDTSDASQSILKAATELMHRCAEDGSLFMPVFADIIFSDGSLETLLALADRADVCVAAPHMRVLPALLDEPGLTFALTGAELVSLAMRHPHSTWTEAEIGKTTGTAEVRCRNGNSFYGGVSWEKRGGLYFVQHNLPSCWIANVNLEDVQFFHGQDGWGGYDHNWGARLLADGRLRMIASSDAAFIVEVTDAMKNLAPIAPVDPERPDAFYRKGGHHSAARSFIGVWRMQ